MQFTTGNGKPGAEPASGQPAAALSRSILFLGSQMATGGAQEILLIQAKWFHAHGYKVIAAFLYDRDDLSREWQAGCSFPLLNLEFSRASGSKFLQLARGLQRLYRLMRKEKFAAIETFTHHANLVGIPLAWLAGIPVRLASHHGRVENFSAPLTFLHTQMINLGFATGLVAVSERVRQQAIAQEHIQARRIMVIANGIDRPANPALSGAQLEAIKQSLDLELDGQLLITVARLKTQKGHTYLLDAIPGVLQVFPKARFAFAGDGPLRMELQDKARQLGILDFVRFLGVRKDIPRLLSAADIFVLPSLWEGLPVALLEAMLAGLPVVAAQVEGVDEVIHDGRNGLLVPPAHPQALSQALIRLLGDAPLRERLGRAGQAEVEQGYTVERMCQGYADLFNGASHRPTIEQSEKVI